MAAGLPLMSKLTAGVTTSPLRLANETVPYSSSQEMYGLWAVAVHECPSRSRSAIPAFDLTSSMWRLTFLQTPG